MGSFTGVGSIGRGARIGWWVTIVGLLVAGAVSAATVVPRSPRGNATGDDLALLRRAPAAVLAEPQVQVTQEMSMPAGMRMTCRVIRPASRCEQDLPGGLRNVYVSGPGGYYLEVPEPRRSATQGKPWVRVEGRDGSGSMADGFAGILRKAKDATVRRDEPLDGSLVTYYRFAIPEETVPSNAASAAAGVPADMKTASVVEAYVDDSGRPLRIVQDMSMKARGMSSQMKMTFTFAYGPVEPFAVPNASDAFTVATVQEATRIVLGR